MQDRFFIVTGISDPHAEEAVVIWSATGCRVASVPWLIYLSIFAFIIAVGLFATFTRSTGKWWNI